MSDWVIEVDGHIHADTPCNYSAERTVLYQRAGCACRYSAERTVLFPVVNAATLCSCTSISFHRICNSSHPFGFVLMKWNQHFSVLACTLIFLTLCQNLQIVLSLFIIVYTFPSSVLAFFDNTILLCSISYFATFTLFFTTLSPNLLARPPNPKGWTKGILHTFGWTVSPRVQYLVGYQVVPSRGIVQNKNRIQTSTRVTLHSNFDFGTKISSREIIDLVYTNTFFDLKRIL